MTALLRVPLSSLGAGERELEREVAHYLVVVHRLAAGDRFVAFDPESATESEAVLLNADPRRARCEIREPRRADVAAPRPVTLLQALCKGDKPEQVVRSATALGVTRIVFVQAERSVVRASEGSWRLGRLRAIAIDAARQSGRGDIPELAGPLSYDRALEELGEREACKLCLHPNASLSLFEALNGAPPEREVALLVGPEGGWSQTEIERAVTAGFRCVRLGRLSLRTELAGVAALGAVLCLSDGRAGRGAGEVA